MAWSVYCVPFDPCALEFRPTLLNGDPSSNLFLRDLDLLVVLRHGGVLLRSPEDLEHVLELERGTNSDKGIIKSKENDR
jgi:hypothetical protein